MHRFAAAAGFATDWAGQTAGDDDIMDHTGRLYGAWVGGTQDLHGRRVWQERPARDHCAAPSATFLALRDRRRAGTNKKDAEPTIYRYTSRRLTIVCIVADARRITSDLSTLPPPPQSPATRPRPAAGGRACGRAHDLPPVILTYRTAYAGIQNR